MIVRTLLVAAVTLGAFATNAALPTGARAACGWYAIGTCARTPPRNPMGWAIVNTSNVSGFRAGFFCVVSGPQTRRGATRDRNILRSNWGVRTAYIKRGCE